MAADIPSLTELLEASLAGKSEVVRGYVLRNANLDERTKEGWSPLIYAAKEGHLETVQVLLSNGAKPNPPDRVTHTALRGASLFGHESVVAALLDANADPDITSSEKKTPLMGACMNGHPNIVKMLLEAGADREMKNDFGETARDLATIKGHADCLHWFGAMPPISPTSRLLRRARTSFTNSGRKSFEAIATSVEQTRKIPKTVRDRASVATGKMRETAEAAQERLKQKQEVTSAQLLLLTIAAVLLIVIVLYFMVVQGLKLMVRMQLLSFYSRSTKLEDFRLWTMEVCTDPWQKETALCQAVDGNWLARQLVLVKLHEASADHCDPDVFAGGCRHEPCQTKGLSKVLLGLADSSFSPINNKLHPIHYVLLPVQKRLRTLLRGLAKGKLPLSQLDKELQTFPLLDRSLPFSRTGRSTREYLMEDIVYPIIRNWGVIIGGSHAKPPKANSCPQTINQVFADLVGRDNDDDDDDDVYGESALVRTVERSVGAVVDKLSWFGRMAMAIAQEQEEEWRDEGGSLAVL